ncbi:ABC transporter ATP-binding protein [Homoserinibacter sp. YIM 151385]|uniref:ABC transporter ATP-binding protein n=1 Tax=Homoserinibacter sp. YIM 151385 TaxID=2985506 RepID=UPI0022F04D31|nr:ABC transporter ATP-binding protein [Homoserinibacter sp. YIM 151385]WBU39014.1 ABC transporter ATP-binding protein [Homoserinibacter sp. YIM 151385]
MTADTPLIDCRDLVRIFSAEGVEVQALQGLDLEVRRGELTAVVGASGSGKSTLLGILSGLDTPTAGSATVDGHDLLAMRGSERTRYRRRSVGYVWQETSRNLLPYLSVAENVAAVLAIGGTARRERPTRTAELLAALEIGELADRRPQQLSGGQRQRAAIAAALANVPAVLLADEPTGELDEASSEAVLEALRDVNERLGATVLVVTHDPGVASHVRRTVQIRDGRTSSEVLRSTRRTSDGGEEHVAREVAVLDRVGRLQLPPEYLAALSLRDRVRLELQEDHVRVLPEHADDEEAGA